MKLTELSKLPWLDQSTADPIEKARRVLDHLVDGSAVYFFEDGFPRTEVNEQVTNVLAVLNALAAASSDAAQAPHGYCVEGENHCVCGGDLPRVREGCANWRKVVAPAAADVGAPVTPFNRETQDQIAAVMLRHGTPEQQGKALEYASAPLGAQPDERAALEAQLLSKDGFHEDPIEDIAHALAHELEDAALNANDYVTVNRQKLRGIAARVLDKARATATQPDPLVAACETLRTAILADSRFAAGLAFGLANLARERGMGGSGSMLEAMRQDAETRSVSYQWRDTGPLETGDPA